MLSLLMENLVRYLCLNGTKGCAIAKGTLFDFAIAGKEKGRFTL